MEGKGGAFGNSLQSLGGCGNAATARQKLPRMLRPRTGGDSIRALHDTMPRVQWDRKTNQPTKTMTIDKTSAFLIAGIICSITAFLMFLIDYLTNKYL